MKIEISQINQNLRFNNYIFIFGIGFDQRCMTVSNIIANNPKIKKSIGILNYTWKHKAKNNKEILEELFIKRLSLIDNENKKIVDLADKFIEIMKSLVNDELNYLIDISAFSHELLSVVLGVLNKFNLFNKTEIVYTGATKYGDWLSRGVIDVRSILGFPGTMLPSKKLHLILMSGFEVGRAIEVFKWYEPASVSIARGTRCESISDDHFEQNKRTQENIAYFIKNLHEANCECTEFEFSCTNPFETKKMILKNVVDFHNYNIVVCPLNNKISTVGAVLAAIENDNIQLSYSQPAEYNVENYVESSNEVRLISLTKQK